MRRLSISAALLGAAVLVLSAPAWAERDPTVPPGWQPRDDGSAHKRREASGRAVLIVNGQAHLIVGSRLYSVGDRLGAARIERITETELWLREGASLRKMPMYPSVQQRVVEGQAAERAGK